MSRLVDPTLCPDCRALLDPAATCTACGLEVTGPLAVELWQRMVAADRVVEQLRALSGRVRAHPRLPAAPATTPSIGLPAFPRSDTGPARTKRCPPRPCRSCCSRWEPSACWSPRPSSSPSRGASWGSPDAPSSCSASPACSRWPRSRSPAGRSAERPRPCGWSSSGCSPSTCSGHSGPGWPVSMHSTGAAPALSSG